MSADIVNLKQFRKQRARAEKEEEASRNRAQFGRTKLERAESAAEVARGAKLLDGARLEPPQNDGRDDPDPGPVS
jgi:hypothetical protein